MILTIQQIKIDLQQLAHGWTGAIAGAAGVTAKAWTDWVLNSPGMEAIVVVVGLLLSITIIAVNVQTFLKNRKD